MNERTNKGWFINKNNKAQWQGAITIFYALIRKMFALRVCKAAENCTIKINCIVNHSYVSFATVIGFIVQIYSLRT